MRHIYAHIARLLGQQLEYSGKRSRPGGGGESDVVDAILQEIVDAMKTAMNGDGRWCGGT